MKWLNFTLAIVATFSLTSCKPRISGQITANWEPDANLRVVDGQIYDIYHSELWKDPLELAGFRSQSNPEDFRLLTYLAKVETVGADKIQCGIYEQAHWPPVANGNVEYGVTRIALIAKLILLWPPLRMKNGKRNKSQWKS